jgi:hypothetical protein
MQCGDGAAHIGDDREGAAKRRTAVPRRRAAILHEVTIVLVIRELLKAADVLWTLELRNKRRWTHCEKQLRNLCSPVVELPQMHCL